MFVSPRSLDGCLRAESVRNILSAALIAADPSNAIRTTLARQASQINSARRVCLLSVGKAGIRMAEAALPFVNSKLADGLVITKYASRVTVGLLVVIEAGHPLPAGRSL